jgi:hypothetical protein
VTTELFKDKSGRITSPRRVDRLRRTVPDQITGHPLPESRIKVTFRYRKPVFSPDLAFNVQESEFRMFT